MSSYSGSSTSGFSWTGVAGLFLLDGFFLPPVFVSPVSDLCDEAVGSLSEDCLVHCKATFCVSVATGSAGDDCWTVAFSDYNVAFGPTG